jgi:hypothetical protein
MDPKLTILFLLIGVVIALSNLTDDRLARLRRQIASGRWRIRARAAQSLVTAPKRCSK